MADNQTTHHQLSDEELKQIVAEADTGGRKPTGVVAAIIAGGAIIWSLFQLWFASPLPFALEFGILNDTEARSLHLAFAVFLSFLAYPAFKRSPRGYVPLADWVLALAGAGAAAYIFFFYAELAQRPGLPTTLDLVVSVVGLALLLEAARRALGLPMVVLAGVFIAYIFLGPYMPDLIAHRGASLSKGMSHLWLTTEGVFGVALGVSTSFIFLFVLFGALLETAGAGNYFIQSAVSMLGHFRGGPAKAAVVASAATGVISGSSIANVVTTGTFTIPLMKRVGYEAKKAGAVEVAASVNGQIMPPVMGAAAFLMVEYVGISYTQVMKHAILPALISYIALFYIVHLEAMRSGIEGLPRRLSQDSWQTRLLRTGMTVSGLILLAGAVYWGLGWIKTVAGDASHIVIALLMLGTYIALLKIAASVPELHLDDPNDPITELPPVRATLLSGLHYLLPVVVLVWNLMVEQLSPGLSAFWATCFMMFILVTQRPILAAMRGQGGLPGEVVRGLRDLYDGLSIGARNMIGIGVATAAAGVIVGTVTLTGVGLVLTELVEVLSGGNLMIMLILVALISLVLGMGLPTTANYIVVSTLMAPVVVELGSQSGLLVPLIAVHMFVFYFGLMADVTPPVGLASYAAAGVARCDPIATGVQAFKYSMRTAILPFMFIFNTQLLLIDIGSWWVLALTIGSAIIAMLVFAAGTQGWFLARSRWYESAALILVAFTLLRPGFWMDMVYPQFEEVPATRLTELVESARRDANLRIYIEGVSIEGKDVAKGVLLPLGAPAENARARLKQVGLTVMTSGDDIQIMAVDFGSRAEKLGIEQGFSITHIELPSGERPAKEWMFVPAMLLLGLVIVLQRRRSPTPSSGRPAAQGARP